MATRWIPLVLLFATIIINLAEANVPAIFVFGDSTADVGTNTLLPGSLARADFPHNGIDFPYSRPTGRFSNGLNSADFLAKLMGYKRSPPPFLSLGNIKSPLKRNFRGINFASGGSGILDKTGNSVLTSFGKESNPSSNYSANQKNVISLADQIQQFSVVYTYLEAIMGTVAKNKFLSKSLFIISVGSNDIFGYYHSNSSLTKKEFLSSLVLTYGNHLKSLLDLGARKIGIVSVPPIGCCPSQRIFNATGGCLEELNDHARTFHAMINMELDKLSSEFKDMKYSLGNAVEMTLNVIENPYPFNFKEVKAACCGAGTFNAESFCTPNASLCLNRKEYLFWDLFHPTQAASKLAALTLYGGEPRFVAPINFSQLASR